MRFASAAKLRAVLVVGGLLLGVLAFRIAFPTPTVVGQEQPGSDLPANWQSLGASAFADLAENYFLSATPQTASRQLLVQHAWTTFLASDESTNSLDLPTLDRLLGIVNLPNAESFGFVAQGLSSYEQSLLMPRWQVLKQRSTDAAVARLGEAGSLSELFAQITQIYASSSATDRLSAALAKQVGDWTVSHAEDLNEASSADLLTLLALLKSTEVQPVTITAQTWITPAVSGTYEFTQLQHGAREGTLTMSVGGQAIYDSSQDEETRFVSSPVALTAGQRVLVEAQYGFDPVSLIKTERATRDLGTERFPVLPVAGLLWKRGDDGPWEVIPEAVFSTDQQGQQPGVSATYRLTEDEPEITFTLTQSSFGWTGNVVSEAQVASFALVAGLLAERDQSELVTSMDEEDSSETPSVYAYWTALPPAERVSLVETWKDRPDILRELSDSQFSQIWQQIYYLPAGLPLELLTAWSEATTDATNQMTLADRWNRLATDVASERSLIKQMTSPQARIGASMVGSHGDLLVDLQTQLKDDDGLADLPLMKVALAGAVASNRLSMLTSLIDQELEQSAAVGDERASWLIADAFKIEAVEGRWGNPEALDRLKEVLLVGEDATLRQIALYELIVRTAFNEEAFDSIAQANQADLGQDLITSIRQWQNLAQPPAARSTETPAPASKPDPYKIVLQQRLEKAQKAGNQQLIARYQQMLGMQP